MKKFLYVEDELPIHKENILRLFDKFLTEEEKKALAEVGKDEFGATNSEIRNALKNCSLVEVESSFVETLRKIRDNSDDYELFVIDRNLAKEPYNFEQIRQIDSDFTEERLEKFRQREGDYFLRYFANHNRKNLEKLYFLTGNDDAFRGGDELKDLLENFDLNEFRSTHFFEKGRQEDTRTLLNLINNSETINLQRENKFYLEILEKWLGTNESKDFTQILQSKNESEKLKDNLKALRELQEKLLTKLASEVFPGLKNNYLTERGLNVRGALRWLNDNPLNFKLKKSDVKNWGKLFEILKKHSGVVGSYLFRSLDTEVQEKLANLPENEELETFKPKIIDNLNRLIQKKGFFVPELVSGQELESYEFKKVAYPIKKLQRKEILQTFEREKLNRFFIDRVLGIALRERETYFNETCYTFGSSIQTIASEAVHGEDFNEKEILSSLIEALKVLIRRFGKLCEQKH